MLIKRNVPVADNAQMICLKFSEWTMMIWQKYMTQRAAPKKKIKKRLMPVRGSASTGETSKLAEGNASAQIY